MACSYKYENQKYEIVTTERSNRCGIFKRGSSLSPLQGFVINTPQLHVPLSDPLGYDIFNFDTLLFRDKNVYRVGIRETLKIDQSCEILKFESEIISIPFVCKKHFSKKCFTEYVDATTTSTSNLIRCMRLISTPDNRNETLELTVNTFKLPKKIKGHKVIKLGKEIIVSTKTIVGDVSKFKQDDLASFVQKSIYHSGIKDSPQSANTTSRITKRKFEVPYPIKLAAGIVAFFGVLEVGSALISKVVNKIK